MVSLVVRGIFGTDEVVGVDGPSLADVLSAVGTALGLRDGEFALQTGGGEPLATDADVADLLDMQEVWVCKTGLAEARERLVRHGTKSEDEVRDMSLREVLVHAIRHKHLDVFTAFDGRFPCTAGELSELLLLMSSRIHTDVAGSYPGSFNGDSTDSACMNELIRGGARFKDNPSPRQFTDLFWKPPEYLALLVRAGLNIFTVSEPSHLNIFTASEPSPHPPSTAAFLCWSRRAGILESDSLIAAIADVSTPGSPATNPSFGLLAHVVQAPPASLASIGRLLACGFDPFNKHPRSPTQTAFHLAGSDEVLALLLQHTQQTGAAGKLASFPSILLRAASCGYTTSVGMLLDMDGDLAGASLNWRTVLHHAVHHVDTLELLLARPEALRQLEKQDGKGDTPLHLALRWQNAGAAAALLRSGAAIGTKNYAEKTPLHTQLGAEAAAVIAAWWRGLPEAERPSLTLLDAAGNTPLHYVTNIPAALTLLSCNVDLRPNAAGVLPHVAKVKRCSRSIKVG